jgi:hypothetical protein
MQPSCGRPATCETSLFRTNGEWPIPLRAQTLYTMRERRQRASTITTRARARRDPAINGFSMFVDILARDAIDSLARFRAPNIVERACKTRRDPDETSGHDPSPERKPDRTG